MRCVVLEVQGYSRGCQFLDKRISRVRVDDNPWRDAKDDDFDAALDWLMKQDFKFEGRTGTVTTMGTDKVLYFYRK